MMSKLLDDLVLDHGYFANIHDNIVLVMGAGPSIEEDPVQQFIRNNFSITKANSKNKPVVIVADGATELCLRLDIVPDFIVSDLDGDLDYLNIAEEKGSTLLIHGHGDNTEIIKSKMSHFARIIGTTQTFPLHNVHNFGGFTDGDRGVFLAHHFNARKIFLVGMDFESKIGYYSKKNLLNKEYKKQKLRIAKYLVRLLIEDNPSLFVNIASSKYGSSLSGIVKNKLI